MNKVHPWNDVISYLLNDGDQEILVEYTVELNYKNICMIRRDILHVGFVTRSVDKSSKAHFVLQNVIQKSAYLLLVALSLFFVDTHVLQTGISPHAIKNVQKWSSRFSGHRSKTFLTFPDFPEEMF